MSQSVREQELIQKIHDLSGELGGLLDSCEDEKRPDAENYEYQVSLGLAEATSEILKRDPCRLTVWLGYGLISCGVEIDPRVQCLIDSFRRELEERDQQMDEE